MPKNRPSSRGLFEKPKSKKHARRVRKKRRGRKGEGARMAPVDTPNGLMRVELRPHETIISTPGGPRIKNTKTGQTKPIPGISK